LAVSNGQQGAEPNQLSLPPPLKPSQHRRKRLESENKKRKKERKERKTKEKKAQANLMLPPSQRQLKSSEENIQRPPKNTINQIESDKILSFH